MSGNELPKVIEKTEADIDAVIVAIKSCDLPSSTKDFAISCIRLAVWLPKALLEHKIKLSNLRKLIFGRGKKNNGKPNRDSSVPAETSEPESPAPDVDVTPSETHESE